MKMNVFEEAAKIVNGDREQQYGKAERNFQNIADQWSLYIKQKHGIAVELTDIDIGWMMADLKKCRQMNMPKRDNIVDAIGYIGLTHKEPPLALSAYPISRATIVGSNEHFTKMSDGNWYNDATANKITGIISISILEKNKTPWKP